MKKVLFIGSKNIGLISLKTLYRIAPDSLISIVTFDDRKDKRSEFDRFVEFSEAEKIPLHVLEKPADLAQIVENLGPDLCAVIGWYWIISKQVFGKVKDGFVGVHGSLLPKYRGGAPLVWAIINGEKESGVSLFYFDEGMDTGDIIGQERFQIGENDSIRSILMKAESLTKGLFERCYPLLLAGDAPRTRQDHELATYASQRSPKDGKIDWNGCHADIHNFVRAQTYPYPGAYCYCEDRKIFILKTSLFEYPYSGVPGRVARHSDGSIVVGCGTNALYLHEVQRESEAIAPAAAVLGNGQYLS